jgi:hypothetical protein
MSNLENNKQNEKEVKVFFWADLAGGGRFGLVHESKLVGVTDEVGTEPPFYNDETTLSSFVETAKQGSEWYNATDSYTCIGTTNDLKQII